MEWLLAVTSWFLLCFAYGEAFETNLKEDELYECYIKLLCELDKVDEMGGLAETAGPELAQTGFGWIGALMKMDFPADLDTKENWNRYAAQICLETVTAEEREKGKKDFNDFGATAAEYMVEICAEAEAETCKRMELVLDQLSTIFGKYEAMGVCKPDIPVAGEMMPEGPGEMKPPSFG